jgi:MFS family permease
MGYFGLTYNTPAMDWNIFLVFSFPGMVGYVLGVIEPFIENKFGRKPVLTISLTCCGILLLSTMFFPSGSPGITVCALLGTMFAGAAFGCGYSITKEIMPTVARTSALSTASASARIGSMLSPVIGMLDVYMEVSMAEASTNCCNKCTLLCNLNLFFVPERDQTPVNL